MLRKLINRKIDAVERDLGAPVDEMRYVSAHSLRAFRALAGLGSIADFHHALPLDVYYTAKIAAYRQEDCGSCLQIAVHLARKHRVPAEIIRAAVNGRVEALPGDLALVFRFAENQANRIDDEETREKLRSRYGDAGLIELAMAIGSARMFPALKRALGFAKSCSLVHVEV